MKLISVYVDSHTRLLNNWFLPTLQDNYELCLHLWGDQCRLRRTSEKVADITRFKCDRIIEMIRSHPGEIFIFSDVDIQFFGPTRTHVLEAMIDKDIVCQVDSPTGEMCSGFFAIRGNDATLKLWTAIRNHAGNEKGDQPVFNRLLPTINGLHYGYLPVEFFGAGTFSPTFQSDKERLYIPRNPLTFNVNRIDGVENKLRHHQRVRSLIEDRLLAIPRNNGKFCLQGGWRHLVSVKKVLARRDVVSNPSYARPTRVSLDASTVCQLKCPSCPTSTGAVAKGIGGGLLSLRDFRRFVQQNPWIKKIELSNWGEVFLNPELSAILEYAHDRAIRVDMANGVNLNTASDETLESLVRYKVRRITCSIDGASQKTYALYRKRGNYNRVIENIRKVNKLKSQYGSRYPVLVWQFVVFGHNEHEINRARRLSARLGMRFAVKLSWNDLYTETFSPVSNRQLVRKLAGVGAADRKEYEDLHGKHYISGTCEQLWQQPRVNFDGKLLGCAVNHWGDYGNVFDDGLGSSLMSEKMIYAKGMLRGILPTRPDIPCAQCKVYADMKLKNTWVNLP